MNRRKELRKARRIIVKVGTSSLSHSNGTLDLKNMDLLVRELVDLKNQEYEIALVSSGAIGAGMSKLQLKDRPKLIPEKQALAAIGQGALMHIYEKLMGEYGQLVAQLLLTKGDLNHRKRFLNARNTLFSLFRYGVIPIINENDTVAFEEIRFGDNDTLASLVALLVDADLVILLTDIDALYTDNPAVNENAERVSIVETIDEHIENMAGLGGKFGTGGMITKIHAAKIATNSGIPLVIAEGKKKGIIADILAGNDVGTLFLPQHDRYGSRKNWITYGSESKGKIFIDQGAQKAVTQAGKSLLASGITKTVGDFQVGDIVEVVGDAGKPLARGVVNYSAKDINKIKGAHSDEIADILGYKDFNEVIHRDNLGLTYKGRAHQ